MVYDHSTACAAWQAPHFQKLDPTHAAIRKAIVQFQTTTFVRFSFNMSVSPCETRSETAGLGHHPATQKFLFEADGKSPRKMWVKLDIDQGVMVKLYPREYVPIADYLKLLPIIQDPNTWCMEFRLEHQFHWWLANKKVFPFFELPAEIRTMIYSYAIGPYLDPYPSAKFRARRIHSTMNTTLMHTNKRLYYELRHVLYDRTPFYIEYSRLFERMVRNTAFPLSSLRILELAFSHVSFLKFFGCYLCDDQDAYEICFEPSAEAKVIGRMTRLKRLTLVMPTPADLIDIPWTNGCQKKMVDWILEVAWPFVKGQNVFVEGFVRTEQKATFEAMARKEFERRRRWEDLREVLGLEADDGEDGSDLEDGGVKLDGGSITEPAVEVVNTGKYVDKEADEMVTLPPICHCELPCHKPESWGAVC